MGEALLYYSTLVLVPHYYIIPQSVVTVYYLRQYFPSSYSKNEAELSASSAWWPLNGGDNNERTIAGTVKSWRGRFKEVLKFADLFYKYFETLITGPLIEGGRLIGSRLIEIRLY